MASAHYVVTTAASPESVWAFCAAPQNWVGLIPGYRSHEALDERRSAWQVQIDLGAFNRLVAAEVTVTEIIEHEMVKFQIQGSNETPFTGEGSVRTEPGADATTIVVDITMTPQGPLGPVVNAIAAPVLPKVTHEFATQLIRAIDDGIVADRVETGSAGSDSVPVGSPHQHGAARESGLHLKRRRSGGYAARMVMALLTAWRQKRSPPAATRLSEGDRRSPPGPQS